MERNIYCLLEACHRLDIRYEWIDKESNFLRLGICGRQEYFQINRTPFNTEAVAGICKDKMHTYKLVGEVVPMPFTMSFLDWNIDQKYHHYLRHYSLIDIVHDIESNFKYPLVIKQNRGALGRNVFLCDNRDNIGKAVCEIFDTASRYYDYIVLAQQFIFAEEEYRLVCAFGEPVLVYKRGNSKGFNVRYWETGESAFVVDDQQLIAELYEFVRPVFDILKIGMAGFDIIRDSNGRLFLIEINSSPKVDHVVEGGGQNAVVDMYEKILRLYTKELSS